MEALDQRLAAALVLLGIAAMLYGVATVYRSVTDAKVQQQELELELDSRARASERLREQAARHKERDDLLLALVPAGTALVGHWLGRRGLMPSPDPALAPCMGCIPKPPRPVPPPDDDETIEIDLRSLLDALGELGFDDWLTTQMRSAKANQAEVSEHDDPMPTPDVAPGMS